MCRDHGIKHLLTAPRSPTTTGKVERFHKTVGAEFLAGKSFASIADAQAQLDGWVHHYNYERPHQSLGMAVPWDRFRLAQADPVEPGEPLWSAVSKAARLLNQTSYPRSLKAIQGVTCHRLAGLRFLQSPAASSPRGATLNARSAKFWKKN
jgi:hypothetical protein